MADKLLSISLLVSGREDTTEKCLRSLKRIRDELNTEIILVDTGCPDTWQKPLESYADKFVPFMPFQLWVAWVFLTDLTQSKPPFGCCALF